MPMTVKEMDSPWQRGGSFPSWVFREDAKAQRKDAALAASLIDELQLDASNSNVSVSNLLRKTLMVAAKLEVSDIPEWVNKELSGYRGENSVPSYRTLYGSVKAKSLRGWIPVQFPTTEMRDMVSQHDVHESVAQIEALLGRDGSLRFGFPPEGQQILQNAFVLETEFMGFLERASLDGILDEIRNRVLHWAIALDRAGIRGNGLAFTDPEKEKAHSMTVNVNSENFTVGTLGGTGGQSNVATGNNPRVNIRSEDSSTNSIVYQTGDMAKLVDEFSKLRAALLPRAHDAEHYAAIGAVASAEIAAKESQSSTIGQALSALGTGGKWVFDVATEIGVHLAAAALKPYLGLPPG